MKFFNVNLSFRPYAFLLGGILLLILFQPAYAQVPAGMNYQAVVRDGQQVVANQVMGVEFSLFRDSLEVYRETQILTSNEYGLIHCIVGEGNPITGQMDTLDWQSGNYAMQVSVDVGNGFENLGEMPFTSVPYSRLADQVSNLENHTLGDLEDVDDMIPAQDQVLTWDGSEWVPAEGSPWDQSGSTVSYTSGSVGIGTTSPGSQLAVQGTIDVLDLSSGSRNTRVFGWGGAEFRGDNGNRNVYITYPSSSLRNNGFVGLYDASGNLKGHIQVNSASTGGITLDGANGDVNVVVGYVGTAGNHGYVGANDQNGDTRANIYSNTSNIGVVQTYGSNGNSNAAFGYLTGYPNNGYVSARRSSGTNEAGMYVNSSNQGIVWGDVKNFRLEHPTQPGKEIWYACIEGPEAAAYDRGTATLVNGKATVSFSDHFEIVASTQGMTVILTPLSGASEGLAVVNKSATGFEVVELRNGTGNYDFDWEVKCVRKGYENYRVIRDEIEALPGDLNEEGIGRDQ